MAKFLKFHCRHCGCQRHFEKHTMRHGQHLAATILSGGLWAIGWIAFARHERRSSPWRCSACHNRLHLDVPQALERDPSG